MALIGLILGVTLFFYTRGEDYTIKNKPIKKVKNSKSVDRVKKTGFRDRK